MLQQPSSNHTVKDLIRFVSRFARRVVEVVLYLDFIWYSKLVVKNIKKIREIFFNLNQRRNHLDMYAGGVEEDSVHVCYAYPNNCVRGKLHASDRSLNNLSFV